jgi:hypothetical protein
VAGVIKMIINKPKNINLLYYAAILCLFLIPQLTYAADVYYTSSGTVHSLKSSAISIGDGFYTFSPTVKVLNIDGSASTIKSLKKGEYVQLSILSLDNKKRVDSIRRLPEPKIQAQQK